MLRPSCEQYFVHLESVELIVSMLEMTFTHKTTATDHMGQKGPFRPVFEPRFKAKRNSSDMPYIVRIPTTEHRANKLRGLLDVGNGLEVGIDTNLMPSGEHVQRSRLPPQQSVLLAILIQGRCQP